MPFQNPVTSLPIDAILSGAINGLFTVGDPAHAHAEIGTKGAKSGIRLYGPDGVTILIDMDIAGAAVAGSTVTGTVANAAAAATVPASGIQSGGIAGLLTVGNPAAAHAEIGTNSGGKSGIRLYAADGVTILIDLDITAGPVISTAASGQRIVLDSSNANFIGLFTGDAQEVQEGILEVSKSGAGNTQPTIQLSSPDFNPPQFGTAFLILRGVNHAGTLGSEAILHADKLTLDSDNNFTGTPFFALTNAGLQLGLPALPVVARTNITNLMLANGWTVGVPAPSWVVDAAGCCHLEGRLIAPGVLPGNNTPCILGGFLPVAAVSGRHTVAYSGGVGQAFIGNGLNTFFIPAGSTFMDLNDLDYMTI